MIQTEKQTDTERMRNGFKQHTVTLLAWNKSTNSFNNREELETNEEKKRPLAFAKENLAVIK